MKFFLLDVVANSEIVRDNMGIVLFMAMCILSEAVVIWRLKTAPDFKKALLYSTLVNMATLLCGFVLVPVIESLLNNRPQIYTILLCFFCSILIEGPLLKLLIKNSNWKSIFITTVLMNLASYGILLLALMSGHFG